VGHACLEAGHQFEQPEKSCNLILLSLPSKKRLQAVIEEAELFGIRWAIFEEPDHNLGLTAACTEPITGVKRRVFQYLPLWRISAANHNERGPPTSA
jgi:hypothetical protein